MVCGLLCFQALSEPSKASALGAIECADVLKDCTAAHQDDKIGEEMVHKVEECASEMELKMLHTIARVSRTPGHFCQTREREAMARNEGTVIWQCELPGC